MEGELLRQLRGPCFFVFVFGFVMGDAFVEIRPFVFDYIVIDVTLETCGVCVSFCVSLLLLSLCSEGRRREVSFCEFFFDQILFFQESQEPSLVPHVSV
jgi:hypothetical protein